MLRLSFLTTFLDVGMCPFRGIVFVQKCVPVTAVVVYCHSSYLVMARFLIRAQDNNMTNGDFAFFTFDAMRSFFTDKPWSMFNRLYDYQDPKRRRQAFYAVKQVHVFSFIIIISSSS